MLIAWLCARYKFFFFFFSSSSSSSSSLLLLLLLLLVVVLLLLLFYRHAWLPLSAVRRLTSLSPVRAHAPLCSLRRSISQFSRWETSRTVWTTGRPFQSHRVARIAASRRLKSPRNVRTSPADRSSVPLRRRQLVVAVAKPFRCPLSLPLCSAAAAAPFWVTFFFIFPLPSVTPPFSYSILVPAVYCIPRPVRFIDCSNRDRLSFFCTSRIILFVLHYCISLHVYFLF